MEVTVSASAQNKDKLRAAKMIAALCAAANLVGPTLRQDIHEAKGFAADLRSFAELMSKNFGSSEAFLDEIVAFGKQLGITIEVHMAEDTIVN